MGKTQSVVFGLAMAGLLSACAHAAPGGGDRPSGPPPEAFTACEGMSEGDTVSFEGRQGETIEATCQEHDGKLVAVPENGPGPRGH